MAFFDANKIRFRHFAAGGWFVVFGMCAFVGCRQSEPEPLSEAESFQQQLEQPALYFTAETNTRVIAPAKERLFVDEKTGELAWPAMECGNPDCPGRGENGEPFLFIEPDPGMVIQTDGSIGYDPSKARAARNQVMGCPKCLETRDLKNETAQQRQQYIRWVRVHKLAE